MVVGVKVGDGLASSVGAVVSVGWLAVEDGVSVASGEAGPGVDGTTEGVGDGVGKGESGRGDSSTVAVGGGVSVEPASTSCNVGVGWGVDVGVDWAVVVVGEGVPSSAASSSVGRKRVALGTMVMRGTGEPSGVRVNDGISTGVSATVGDG